MLKYEDLAEGTVLRFIYPTYNWYTKGDTYEVLDVSDIDNIEVTDNDRSGVWDMEHLSEQFEIV